MLGLGCFRVLCFILGFYVTGKLSVPLFYVCVCILPGKVVSKMTYRYIVRWDVKPYTYSLVLHFVDCVIILLKLHLVNNNLAINLGKCLLFNIYICMKAAGLIYFPQIPVVIYMDCIAYDIVMARHVLSLSFVWFCLLTDVHW